MTALSELFWGNFSKKCKKAGQGERALREIQKICASLRLVRPLSQRTESLLPRPSGRVIDRRRPWRRVRCLLLCQRDPFKEPPPLVMVPLDEVEALK
jgi:hypothetical protein